MTLNKNIALSKNNRKQSYVNLNEKLNKLNKKYQRNAHKFLSEPGLNIPNIEVKQQMSILNAKD